MRVLVSLASLVAVAACGIQAEPVPGTYLVTLTLNGALCPNSTSTADDQSQTWIIAKEASGYSLTVQDEQGNAQIVATSNNGNRFTGGGDANILGCIFHVGWEMDVVYEKNGISGVSTSTLSAGCAAGTCSERRDFDGTKQD